MVSLEKIVSGELINIKIPPRPAVLLNVQREMRASEPDFVAIEEIISLDVAISASLVKIANSALFARNYPVRSIKDALQALGLNTVASVVTAIALRGSFSHVPNLERFWDSSARIAQLSGWLASQLTFEGRNIKPEEAFTFGLFRDCGIPILLSMYSDYLDILKRANAEETQSFTSVEVSELDLNHSMIGAMLVEEWALPIEFHAAIEFHHEADAIRGDELIALHDASKRLIAVAQLSEFLFQSLTGLNQTCEWNKLGDLCLSELGIAQEQVNELIARAAKEGVHTYPII